MPQYEVKVVVEFNFDIEAESLEEAKAAGYEFDKHAFAEDVLSIDVKEVAEELEDEID